MEGKMKRATKPGAGEEKAVDAHEAVRKALEILRGAGIRAELARLYGAGGDMIYLGGYHDRERE